MAEDRNEKKSKKEWVKSKEEKDANIKEGRKKNGMQKTTNLKKKKEKWR